MIGRRSQEVVTAIEEYSKKYLKYDPDSGDLTYKIASKMNRIKPGTKVDKLGPYGYYRISLFVERQKVDVQVHRLVWFMHYGAWPDGDIDHIDHVKTNNKIKNLRCVTPAQNMMNTGVPKNNTSGYTGVTWNKTAKKWQAQYIFKGKCFYLGVFNDKDEAAECVRISRLERGFHKNHGENFS